MKYQAFLAATLSFGSVLGLSVHAYADVVGLPPPSAFLVASANYLIPSLDSGDYHPYQPITQAPVFLSAHASGLYGGQADAYIAGYATSTLPNPFGPGISLSTVAVGDDLGVEGADAIMNTAARLDYYFRISGPAASVPVHALGLLSVAGTNVGQAQAFLSVTDMTTGTIYLNNYCQNFGPIACNYTPDSPAGEFAQLLTLPVGDEMLVTIAGLTQAAGLGGSATVHVDPTFLVDPTAPNGDQYSIAFSQGILNGALAPIAVPEPGMTAVLGLGLLGIAGLRLRRRQAVCQRCDGRTS